VGPFRVVAGSLMLSTDHRRVRARFRDTTRPDATRTTYGGAGATAYVGAMFLAHALADRTEGFRDLAAYVGWCALVHRSHDPFPTVEHTR
jgi:hypothetical protein